MGPRRCGAEGRCTGRVVVSNPRTLREAKDVSDAAQKDDGVTSRIRSIPLQFMVRDSLPRTPGAHRAARTMLFRRAAIDQWSLSRLLKRRVLLYRAPH